MSGCFVLEVGWGCGGGGGGLFQALGVVVVLLLLSSLWGGLWCNPSPLIAPLPPPHQHHHQHTQTPLPQSTDLHKPCLHLMHKPGCASRQRRQPLHQLQLRCTYCRAPSTRLVTTTPAGPAVAAAIGVIPTAPGGCSGAAAAAGGCTADAAAAGGCGSCNGCSGVRVAGCCCQ